MNKNQVSLTVSGVSYYGWLDVSVSAQLQSIARSFSVSLTTKTSQSDTYSFNVDIGEIVELKIGDDLVLSGFITKIDESFSGQTHQITIVGQSKTIDLVECCVPDVKALSYKQLTVAQVVADLIGHYGIELVEEVKKTEVIDFDVSPEEKIKESLDKLIKKHNFLLTDNEKGQLVIASAGSAGRCNDRIVLGVNVLSRLQTKVASPLFCRYVVLGQGANPLSERPLSDNQLKCVAENSKVRFRVCTRVQSGNATQTDLQTRAIALKDISKAEAERLTYTVQGWRQSNGDLWKVNTLVLVDDSPVGIHKEYLIDGVKYSMNDKGLITTLSLTQPEKYFVTKEQTPQEAIKKSTFVTVGDVAGATWTSK